MNIFHSTHRPFLFRFVAGVATVMMLVAFGVGCNGGGGTILVCRSDGRFFCPGGLYCHLGPNCGGIDQEGECRPFPRDCPTTAEPVCSCDGKNFENACYANAAGATVAYTGGCMKK